MSRVGFGVLLITLLGCVLRIAYALNQPLMAGDPLYSYSYRALLISHGNLDGVFLLWHPPGYPLLLAAGSLLTGRTVPPYYIGCALSILTFAGTCYFIDRLIRPRVAIGSTRLVATSFLSLYEVLLINAAGPLSEPPYLFLLSACVFLFDVERIAPARALLVGAILGFAATVRIEAVFPTAGIGLYLLFSGLSARTKCLGAGLFGFGFVLTSGWMFANLDYLITVQAYQRNSYTIPPATTLKDHLLRIPKVAYHAATVWLPLAVLLPYWIIAGAGLFAGTSDSRSARLHRLMLAIVLPSLLGVAWTIMHKRTASFLLPWVAIWFALGTEVLVTRLGGLSTRRLVFAIPAVAFALNIVQISRLALAPPANDETTSFAGATVRAGRELQARVAEPGTVWAFGSESEVYAAWNQPQPYPFFDRWKDYNLAYARHRGSPIKFLRELRSRGFRYLMFTFSEEPTTEPLEEQTYASGADGADGTVGPDGAKTPMGPVPLRSDLLEIRTNLKHFGLRDLSPVPDPKNPRTVCLFEILYSP